MTDERPSLAGRLAQSVRWRLGVFYRTHLLRDPFQLEVNRWFRDRGDETRRLDYPLTAKSLVLDLGGYQGDFAAAIHERYGCKVLVFEPARRFFETCRERFKGNPKVTCFPFGLSSKRGSFFISDEDNASSLVNGKATDQGEKVRVEKITDFLKAKRIGKVDLMKINIEGGEFDVLPCLIEAGRMKDIRFLQVQFHPFIEGAEAKRDAIREGLAKTHRESWNYRFVWESWEKKVKDGPGRVN